MHQLTEFLLRHWLLSSTFVLLLALLIWEEARAGGMSLKASVQEIIAQINNHDTKIIDIRDHKAFENGHILNSVNVRQDDLLKKTELIIKDKEQAIILVCDTGQKSGSLAMKLKKAGVTNIKLISGGLNEWKRAKMPTIKGRK